MLSQRGGLLRFCFVWTFAAILCLQGCRKQEPASAYNPASDKVAEPDSEPVPEKAQYANDLDRLGQITDRVNRACRGSHMIVLGSGDSALSGGLVSVDYALFDKLSDDGAAVLIAEAIAAKSRSPSPSHLQAEDIMEKVILQADEAAGRYVARAGFVPAGFTEWLEAKKSPTADLQQQNGVPDKMRIAAFMRGYWSGRYSKAR